MSEVLRHGITAYSPVAQEFSRKSMLMIQQDPGDEVLAPSLTSFLEVERPELAALQR